MRGALFAVALAATLISGTAFAATYPNLKSGDWTLRNFTFHTGETMGEVNLHYTTIGDPKGEPVVIMHGTGGSGTSFLNAAFGDQMFGPGQPLDATKYYVILPDAIGSGQSAKPSDGLGPKFPKYDYGDEVDALYHLVKDGLGVSHVRIVMGNSMGGMETWLWGEKYPTFMDALVPMASTPAEMSGRNWMLRRMMVQIVLDDPAYNNGNYTSEPASLKDANIFFGIATSGGTLALQAQGPTRAAADKIVDARLAGPAPGDANDFVYQWLSSGDFNPTPDLGKIQAAVLAINSADDERNPPETGLMAAGLQQVKNGKLYVIPASAQTSGHGTTGNAALWKQPFADFLASVPHQPVGQ